MKPVDTFTQKKKSPKGIEFRRGLSPAPSVSSVEPTNQIAEGEARSVILAEISSYGSKRPVCLFKQIINETLRATKVESGETYLSSKH